MASPLNEPWLKDWEMYYTTSHQIAAKIDHLRKQLYKAALQIEKERADEAFLVYITEKECVLQNAQGKIDLSAKYLKKAKDQEPESIPNTYSPGHGALDGGPSMMALLSVAECLLREAVEEVKALAIQI